MNAPSDRPKVGMATWFFTKNGRRVGPVNPQAVENLIKKGVIGPYNFLWNTSDDKWVRAKDTRFATVFQELKAVQNANKTTRRGRNQSQLRERLNARPQGQTMARVVIAMCFLWAGTKGVSVFLNQESLARLIFKWTGYDWLFMVLLPLVAILSFISVTYSFVPTRRWYNVARSALVAFVVESLVGSILAFTHAEFLREALATSRGARGLPVNRELLDLMNHPTVILFVLCLPIGGAIVVLMILNHVEKNKTYPLELAAPSQSSDSKVYVCKDCQFSMTVAAKFHGRQINCTDCGAPFLIPSVFEEATSPSDSLEASSDEGATRPQPHGYEGWFLLAIIWISVNACMVVPQVISAATFMQSRGSIPTRVYDELLPYAEMGLVVNVIIVLFAVLSVVSFFWLKRWARSVVILFLISCVAIAMYDFHWANQVFSPHTLQLLDIDKESLVPSLLGRVGAAVGWLLYFSTSERVRNTLLWEANH